MENKIQEFYYNSPIPFVILKAVSIEKKNITDTQNGKQDLMQDFAQGYTIEDANRAFCDRLQIKCQEIRGKELSEVIREECSNEFTFFSLEDGYLGAICTNVRQKDWQESAMNLF